MAVASLLDYHGNPVRRKGLIKIRANGTRSGIAETLGKALSRSPSSSLNSSVDPVVNRPGPFAGHSPSPPSSQRVHGDCDFALSSLLYLLRDRVLWPIESTSDRGEKRDVFRPLRLSSAFPWRSCFFEGDFLGETWYFSSFWTLKLFFLFFRERTNDDYDRAWNLLSLILKWDPVYHVYPAFPVILERKMLQCSRLFS